MASSPHTIARQTTESILTLQQTIQNIRDDVAAGIAPSIIMPPDNTSDINSGMVLLTLEPSTKSTNAALDPLETRLKDCEARLKLLSEWIPPPTPPKAPEYSIIDISDLSSAIKILEDVIEHTWPPTPPSAHAYLSKFRWTFDPAWKEFYARIPPAPTASDREEENRRETGDGENLEREDETSELQGFLYLSIWHLDEQRQVWEHVSMAGSGMTSETAAQVLGTWEDWKYDPRWKEWYTDVSGRDGLEGVYLLYATPWYMDQGGQWNYGQPAHDISGPS